MTQPPLRLKKPLHRQMKLLLLTKQRPTMLPLMKLLTKKVRLKKQPKKRRLSNPAASGICPCFKNTPEKSGVFFI